MVRTLAVCLIAIGCGGVTSGATDVDKMLGIYRRLLYAKIKEYALEGYPPKGR